MNALWLLLTFVAGALSTGSWQVADMEDPTFHSLLDQHYFPESKLGAEEMELMALETQLVAGINYRATFVVDGMTCEVEMFYQPWTETVEVTADTCNEQEVAEPELMLGEWFEADKDDDYIQQLVEEVYYPSTSVAAEDLQLVRVEHQVVAGMNYKMTFSVVGTDDICVVEMFVQEWTSTHVVTMDGCPDMLASHDEGIATMSGGWGETDHEEPFVQDLLNEVYYPESSVSDGDLEVIGAEKQVVAGVNYRVFFKVAGSEHECHITFFTQAWTNTRMVMEDTCEPAVAEAALLDMMPGGFTPQDPTDPAFTDLLEEVYFPGSALAADDLELVSVETQVVAGVNYRYTFQLTGSDATCQVMVFHQPWSDTKRVTVDTCEDAAMPVFI